MADLSRIPKSKYIQSFTFVGDRYPYPVPEIKGDSYPMTWADDGEIYASSGDPNWGETTEGLDVEKFSGMAPDYVITKANHMNDYDGSGGDGPKPTGIICVDGVLYLAFQNMLRTKVPPYSLISQHGSDAQIVCSANHGATFLPAFGNIKEPMFPGYKFGGPAFINFGRNNENARDGYVYAVSGDQWDNGGNLRLGRVPKEEIMSARSWEWVCAFTREGQPVWSGELEESIPVLSMYKWLGTPEMVYLAGIQRYLLFTWRLHKDFSPNDGTDLIVLESPEPWGPFSLVHFEEYWEGKYYNPYCPRLPLKWVEYTDGGLTGWLQFSGSFRGPVVTETYRSNIRQFRLTLR